MTRFALPTVRPPGAPAAPGRVATKLRSLPPVKWTEDFFKIYPRGSSWSQEGRYVPAGASIQYRCRTAHGLAGVMQPCKCLRRDSSTDKIPICVNSAAWSPHLLPASNRLDLDHVAADQHHECGNFNHVASRHLFKFRASPCVCSDTLQRTGLLLGTVRHNLLRNQHA